jgi:glycosyltransferase involved in cell wall biosynthesis
MYHDAQTLVRAEESSCKAPSQSHPAIAARIALVGGFTPRRCGIATFTADVHASLMAASPGLVVDVYAMTPAPGHLVFDPAVASTITEDDPVSYSEAARLIDESGADMVWLQHEFGLYGGPAGDMILELVDRIAAPLVITLHTVLPEPDAAQRHVMARLVACASKLVVMSRRSAELLDSVYGADKAQIVLIPHGVPDRPFGRSARFKRKFGFAGRQVLMTFGLLSPGKGIEAVIAALPAIIADHPQALYCIIGATHPNLVARDGEAYRERLHALAASLGVEDHIHWIDAFVENEELFDLIEAADIFVTPYPGATQSTSGTLSYAAALGKAVVSTRYSHAVELLSDDHGVLVPFGDSAAIAAEVGGLLDDPERLLALQIRAYARGRSMVWPAVAAQSLAVIEAVRVRRSPPSPVTAIGIEGLLRICDNTGILQHSIHSVPDRAHGYCVDDNARALMLVNRLGLATDPQLSRLTSVFASFVQSAWNDQTQEFRNFMGYGRNWLEDAGSEDSCGRTLWALGATTLEGRTPAIRRWAAGLFDQTAGSARNFQSPRAAAFAMLGADYRLAGEPDHELAKTLLGQGATWLVSLLDQVRSPDWRWFETMLAYDNCRLSEALIRAGLHFGRDDLASAGNTTLSWIMAAQTAPAGHFRPVGADSFGHDVQLPQPFDQQPVEAWAAIDACAAAFEATGNRSWVKQASTAYDWFGGRNDRGVAVGDPVTGSCHDGINPRGLNLNQGAESVLAYQHATIAMRRLLAKSAA